MRSLCVCLALSAAAGTPLPAQRLAALTEPQSPTATLGDEYLPISEVRGMVLALQTPVTVHAMRQPLERVLESIAEQAKIGLSYGENLVRAKSVVSIEMTATPAADVLLAAVRGTSWDVRATTSGRVAVVPRTPPAAAQQQTVLSGRVVDAASGQPLADAQIAVVGTRFAAQSNADGQYRIVNVPAGSYQLRVARIGYKPREQAVQITAGQNATANVSLDVLPLSLESVVVVGYGTQKRRDVTGSVASVTLPEEASAPTVSVEQSLQGKAAGVQVTQANGAPGGAITVRVRGANSLSANAEPLYVVDGVPAFVGSTDAGSVTTGLPTNPLAELNPNDIASIEVLKDASATAIYGSRGANGVILITTKRGKVGQNQFAIESSYGEQHPSLNGVALMPAAKYMTLYNVARANSNMTPFFTDQQIATAVNNNWFDDVLRTAGVQSHSLSANGGDDKTQYLVSLGLFDQDGIIVRSGFRRYSARLNLNRDMSSRFRIGNTLTLSRTNSNNAVTDNAQGPQAGVIMGAMEYPTFVSVRDSLGNYSVNPFGAQANPVATALEITNNRTSWRALGNLFGEFDVTKELKLRTSLGGNVATNELKYYAPSITVQGGQYGGRAQVASTNVGELLNENTLSYKHALSNSQNLDLLAGFTVQTSHTDGVGATSQGFATDITGADNLGAGSTPQAPSTGVIDWAILSYLGRANYSLKDRYLLTFTGRYDGSSKFGADNKWGFFPSAALGWRISEEPFMRGLTASGKLSEVKLRTSYGLTGNQEIGSYNSLAQLTPYSYVYGGTTVVGYAPNARRPNPDLKWESTGQFDAGVDISFFKNRLSLTGDYYTALTKNLLLSVAQADITGYDTQLRNVGSVKNWGLEFGVTTTNIERPHLTWTSSLNLSKNRNHIVDLGPLDEISGGTLKTSGFGQVGNTTVVRVGHPIGEFYGYKVLGLWQQGQSGAGYEPGEYHIQDTNADGQITDADRVFIGDPTPKLYGGFTNDMTYRSFSLNIGIIGSYGGKIANLGAIKVNRGIVANGGVLDGYDDYWTPTNTDATLPKPRLSGRNPRLYSTFVEDGSFLRLSSVTLGWVVPKVILPRVQRARLYVTGQNLWLLTKYDGFDPEVNSAGGDPLNRGIDIGTYPRARTFNVGVNATF